MFILPDNYPDRRDVKVKKSNLFPLFIPLGTGLAEDVRKK